MWVGGCQFQTSFPNSDSLCNCEELGSDPFKSICIQLGACFKSEGKTREDRSLEYDLMFQFAKLDNSVMDSTHEGQVLWR